MKRPGVHIVRASKMRKNDSQLKCAGKNFSLKCYGQHGLSGQERLDR